MAPRGADRAGPRGSSYNAAGLTKIPPRVVSASCLPPQRPHLSSGRRSAPQPPRIEPDRAAPLVANFLHHVARAAWPVAPLAIPEADEIDLVGTEPQGGTQHPAVIELVRILALLRRTK